MPLSGDLQNYLFQHIMSRFGKKSEAVHALCTVLNLSREAIYKRLRGDKGLSMEEMMLLARHFQVSIDHFLFGNADNLVFTFNPFVYKVASIQDFWRSLEMDIKAFRALPAVDIYYASTEIPVFFHFFIPELLEFKLYVWGRSVWHLPYLQKRAFHFGVIPLPDKAQAADILEAHRLLATTEVWSLNVLDNTINQIEYHFTSGLFEVPADALVLCDALLRLIDHTQLMSEKGKKTRLGQPISDYAGQFRLYHNEIIYTNNTILVQSDSGNAVYSTFGSPNFLKSTDERLCQYTANWFDNLIRQSTLISETGEKARQHFFDRLRRRVTGLKTRLSNMLLDDIR